MAGRPRSGQSQVSPHGAMRSTLSAEEVTQLRDAFALFDTEQSGRIDASDLRSILLSVGLQANTPTMLTVLSDLERHQKSKLTFEEFVNILAPSGRDQRPSEPFTEGDIHRVFRLFDNDMKGTVNVKDLQKICGEIREHLPVDEMKEMISQADTDGDGEVTLEDFQNIMSRRLIR